MKFTLAHHPNSFQIGIILHTYALIFVQTPFQFFDQIFSLLFYGLRDIEIDKISNHGLEQN